jgi:uncharacterized protein (UPF0262 family)
MSRGAALRKQAPTRMGAARAGRTRLQQQAEHGQQERLIGAVRLHLEGACGLF